MPRYVRHRNLRIGWLRGPASAVPVKVHLIRLSPLGSSLFNFPLELVDSVPLAFVAAVVAAPFS